MPPLETPVVIVVPGDLHLTEPDLDNARVAHWAVGEVNGLIRPDFVQFIGDNVQDATEAQFRLFGDVRRGLEVPHFALVGDHDIKGDPDATGFRRHVGAAYGATSLHGFRFLRLNTQEARPVGLSIEQVGWFRGEVDGAIARGERVVIFQHNYPYQIWEEFAGPGIDEWRAVVQTRRITAIVCGHTHYGQIANDGRNVTVATRSIGDPEGGPPGYTLLYLRGDDLALTYRTIADDGPLVLVTHPREMLLATGPGHVVSGPDEFRVRTWSATSLVSARGQVDGGDWFGFESGGDDALVAPLHGDRLSKGGHTFDVEIIDASGRQGRRHIEFMVDPTGRYTAVPSVQPRVRQTAFC